MAKILVNRPEKWERVNDEDDEEITQRLKVFGGWLVITHFEFERTSVSSSTLQTDDQYAISQSFVPDPSHEWEI